MTTPEDKVHEQHQKYLAELPALLAEHEGRWVVYLDGPRAFFEDEWKALEWASQTLGDDTPFVIARVEPERVILLTAALAFGGSGT